MNREIKFRAWIPALNIMVYDVDVYADGRIGFDYEKIMKEVLEKGFYFDKDSGNVLASDYFEDGETATALCHFLYDDDYIWFEKPDYILMQYTGLHVIYEGDIPETKDIALWCNDCKSFQWFWIYEGKRVCHNCEGDFQFDEIDDFYEELKIIGNIYENEELIKET
jgi:hypothetical protein